ncbi:LacI family DNA-binding transcriptional regulator [Sphingomonas sp. CFBP8993]|uniref:LacI family DNA-binding transcriptional regulator n=1 Tax=Sphingomonas sp. CFBP8993 TaxID=3096526 RepID=UPI002A6B8D33|nr:LacI family DNA-binding transcriptional regulator [Sphingomonas sp. CFBP8993]MDY0959640.1 LacI family DNA-binding transcriptional regulator [Sphingomonas sp. CFBP8993]
MRQSSATIRDVARQAAVSVASVSRAMNGHSSVHPDTRARVMAAAQALGYVPHAGARSLSLSRSHAIGVVLPDLHGEFFSEIVRGMDREVTARGYHLLLSNMHADAELAAQAVRSMRGRVDGLIVMAPQLVAGGLDDALPLGVPAVLVNSQHASGRAAFRIDNAVGIEAVVAHLVAQGRRRLIHVSGPFDNIDADERRQGFLAAMARLAPEVEPIVIEGDFREESGAAAMLAVAERGLAHDGIVAANDMMALGVLSVLRERQVVVPGAVAVTGFDDIPLARYLGLTTVRAPTAELGARAVARLVDALEGGTLVLETQTIATELVIRATSPAVSA